MAASTANPEVTSRRAIASRSTIGTSLNISRRSLLNTAALLSAGRLLRAQQTVPNPSDATFSTNVNVVTLFATVRDKQGQVVRNLTKDDFLLDEDGRPQTIAYFSQESNLPLTVGLLVDTSGSTRRVLPDERDASYRFLGTGIARKTRIRPFSFTSISKWSCYRI